MGTSVKEVKLCLLGDIGVGKSSLVHRFVYDAYKPNIESTIGAAFLTKSLAVDSVVYKFQIWDTAGQEKYRALAPMYYRGAAAAIIAYDITQESSFSSVKAWVRDLKQYAEPDLVLALAGNKADLEDLREVSQHEASEYAEQQGAVLVETSAKTAVNVPALFLHICQRLSARDDPFPSSSHPSSHAGAGGGGSTVLLPGRQAATAVDMESMRLSCCS